MSEGLDYKYIGQIAPGILHDIGNAVSTLRSNIELLTYEQHLDQRALQLSLLSANEIELLLKYFKTELIYQNTKITFNTSEVINGVLETRHTQLSRLGISVETDLKGHCQIKARPTDFHRLFINLFTNAIEAVVKTRDREKSIKIKCFTRKNSYNLSITDNGVGISRSQLRKIRKLQACSDKQDSYVHGFGLRVAFACAANMGAKLTVQSREGQGTTFRLKLGSNNQA